MMRATVVQSLPTYGFAIVTPTNDLAKDEPKLYIAYVNSNCTYYGAGVRSMPTAGSVVLCVPDPIVDGVYSIVSMENSTPLTTSMGNGNRTGFPVSSFCAYQQESLLGMANALIEKYPYLKEKVVNKGVQFRPDSEGGDLDISDAQGYAGLQVSRLSATLHGSQLAYIEVSEPSNQVYIQSALYKNNTLLSEHEVNPDCEVQNMAVSLQESLGCIADNDKAVADPSGDAVPEDYAIPGILLSETGERQDGTKVYGNLSVDMPGALPMFRMQSLKGRAVDGKQDLVVTTPSVFTNETADSRPLLGMDGNEQPILSKRRDTLDGSLQTASTRRSLSVKSPSISGILQAEFKAGTTARERDRLRSPLAPEQPKAEDEPDLENEGSSIDLWEKGKLAGEYTCAQLNAIMRQAGLTMGSVGLKSAEFDPSKEIGGKARSREYPDPASTKIKDPVTQKERKYYASTSFIGQDPDGSIVISDGWGSEIRMSHGNIYISSALDTFIMPGRDMCVMAGGNQSYVSRKGCDVKAGEDVSIGADKDLGMCSGLGGSSGNITMDGLKDVNIFSRSQTTSVEGKDIFIGRRPIGQRPSSAEESGAANPYSVTEEYGSVIIDAGPKGVMNVLANSMEVLAKSSVSAAVCDYEKTEAGEKTNGSVFQVKPNTIELLSTAAQITGYTTLANTSADLSLKVPNKASLYAGTSSAKAKEIRIEGGPKEGSSNMLKLNVQGVVNCDNLMANSNAVVKGQLVGRNIACVGGQVGSANLNDNEGNLSKMWEPIEVLEMTVQQNYLSSSALAVETNQGYKVDWIHRHAFRWPSYENNSPGPVDLPELRWQKWHGLPEDRKASTAVTNPQETPTYWKEKPCVSDYGNAVTYPYPGSALWEDGKIVHTRVPELAETQKETKVNGGYIVNTN